MRAPASRRGFLVGFAALPLVGATVAQAGPAPGLLRLVERYRLIGCAIEAETDHLEAVNWRPSHDKHRRLCVVAGRLRCRIALYPSAGLPDVLLKLMAYALDLNVKDEWDDLRRGIESNGGHAYMDDIGQAALLDLVRIEGIPTLVV